MSMFLLDALGAHTQKFDIFSAVCWLYGKNLYKKLKYPIGLVASDWGGTAVEVWSSLDSLRRCGVIDGHGKPRYEVPK